MCDYSLHMQPNRLAEEGEQLVSHRFCGHTIGLASPADLKAAADPPPKPMTGRWWSWAAIKAWLNPPTLEPKRVPAVCVPPGARLRLHDVPRHLQDELGVGETEDVVFTQLSASEYVHRDGVRFRNGRVVLLQRLNEGQRVNVQSLALPDTRETVEEPFWLPAER